MHEYTTGTTPHCVATYDVPSTIGTRNYPVVVCRYVVLISYTVLYYSTVVLRAYWKLEGDFFSFRLRTPCILYCSTWYCTGTNCTSRRRNDWMSHSNAPRCDHFHPLVLSRNHWTLNRVESELSFLPVVISTRVTCYHAS